MEKQVLIFDCMGDTISAKHFVGDKVTTHTISAKQCGEDFLFGCAYIIDDMATPKNEPKFFNGKAVCCESRMAGYEVGKVYEWLEGYPICHETACCTQRPILVANIEGGIIKCAKVKFVVVRS